VYHKIDTSKDGLVNFAEFSHGLDEICELSKPVKEKLFALMDRRKVGLIDYQSFSEVLSISSFTRQKNLV
jgi:Ca2+-binding EF-hand superfamily protein